MYNSIMAIRAYRTKTEAKDGKPEEDVVLVAITGQAIAKLERLQRKAKLDDLEDTIKLALIVLEKVIDYSDDE